MKKILVIIALAALVLVTVPLWGSCDLNAKLCNGLCSVRHMDSDVRTAGCRARCRTDQLSCLAKQGSRSVEDFIEGFKQ